MNRAPACCSGGHGFDSYWELRYFLCPPLVSWRSIYLSQYYFFSQKRGGRLYINDNEVNDLGIYRNITGFVPQVCFFFYLFVLRHCIWLGYMVSNSPNKRFWGLPCPALGHAGRYLGLFKIYCHNQNMSWAWLTNATLF